MCKHRLVLQDGTPEDGELRASPVWFGLFALAVDEPQVVLGLLRTGLGVQVSHADRLVRRGHARQHRRRPADISKR